MVVAIWIQTFIPTDTELKMRTTAFTFSYKCDLMKVKIIETDIKLQYSLMFIITPDLKYISL